MRYETDPTILNAELIDQIKWLQAKPGPDQLATVLRMRNDRRIQGLCTWEQSGLFWLHVINKTSKGTK